MNTNDFKKFTKSKNISSLTVDRYLNYITPHIIEERDTNIALLDVFSRLLKDKIIFLGVPIDDDVSNIITAQLLYLESNIDSDDIIKMYINSPGGSIYAGNAILDVMDLVSNDVHTVCTGLAASMSAVILSNGKKGNRYTLKRSRVMIHQPLGGIDYAQASDIKIVSNEIERCKIELAETLSLNCEKDIETILSDMDRDMWMNSTESKNYGIIDTIIQ
jgi:ATP-dependent Clp protease, protease subunit